MLKSWDTYELTESGEFFKKAMKGELEFQKNNLTRNQKLIKL